MISQPPPNSDQIELTIFGPGYGECVVVHLGEDQWIVVDSCVDTATGNPVALDYFEAIGVSPQKAVKLIVISHWHDDHVRGLSEIVSSCPKASVCTSAALTQKEFLSHVLNYQNILTKTTPSGVKEIEKILKIFTVSSSPPITKAFANRTVLTLPAKGTANSCVVTTLSPSDKEYDDFLKGIVALMPSDKKTKMRSPSLKPNNVAVAIWIETGDVKMLLGSDLEEKGDPSSGWSAIVQSKERPRGSASIFKIPHHGSVTGHHAQVWSDMLINLPTAILSPFYNAGEMLPKERDVTRILALAPESYITTWHLTPKSKRKRVPSVERSIRETIGKMRAVQPPMGWVRLRNGGQSSPHSWTVELSATGSHLNALKQRAT